MKVNTPPASSSSEDDDYHCLVCLESYKTVGLARNGCSVRERVGFGRTWSAQWVKDFTPVTTVVTLIKFIKK